MPEGMQMVEREPSNRLQRGLEIISDQIRQKRARNGSDQISTPPTLRSSARLNQQPADSEILMKNAQVGSIMEVPSIVPTW